MAVAPALLHRSTVVFFMVVGSDSVRELRLRAVKVYLGRVRIPSAAQADDLRRRIGEGKALLARELGFTHNGLRIPRLMIVQNGTPNTPARQYKFFATRSKNCRPFGCSCCLRDVHAISIKLKDRLQSSKLHEALRSSAALRNELLRLGERLSGPSSSALHSA